VESSRLIEAVYANPPISTRTGPLFAAHPYPTKINPEAVLAFVLAHTSPGDLVFDGFSGSGSLGLAAALASDEALVRQLGIGKPGARRFELYDVSSLASMIAATVLAPPDKAEFQSSAEDLLDALERAVGDMYSAPDDRGEVGRIRHVVWSDLVRCPACDLEQPFSAVFARVDPPEIASTGQCQGCAVALSSKGCSRVTTTSYDDLLKATIEQRRRVPVLVYGSTGTRRWRREVVSDDLAKLQEIDRLSIPPSVPVIPMMNRQGEAWGELHRDGYHTGMSHLHHFYTRRNLIALATAWELASSSHEAVRNAMRLWVSSYNASHSTLMTRVVAKRGAKDFAVTSSQSGALYVSSMPVEKNIISGLRRKLRDITSAFDRIRPLTREGRVRWASSLQVALDSESVDYIFTDPPFGENIQYSEVNFIAEAWLGRTTDAADEVIVSSHQGKSVADYEDLLTAAFGECWRILKPGRDMTVVFHSSDPETWRGLQRAITSSGFEVLRTTVLVKDQGSFKQVTSQNFVRGDCVLLARKQVAANPRAVAAAAGVLPERVDLWEWVETRLDTLPPVSEERTAHRLYSRMIAAHMAAGTEVSISARDFYEGLRSRTAQRGRFHFARGGSSESLGPE
jgi:16S rRNA G966 N2-methylase RsmD